MEMRVNRQLDVAGPPRRFAPRNDGIKKPQSIDWGFLLREPDDALLSRQLSHYHRRKGVSRSCSGWEGVVPTRYGHRA